MLQLAYHVCWSGRPNGLVIAKGSVCSGLHVYVFRERIRACAAFQSLSALLLLYLALRLVCSWASFHGFCSLGLLGRARPSTH